MEHLSVWVVVRYLLLLLLNLSHQFLGLQRQDQCHLSATTAGAPDKTIIKVEVLGFRKVLPYLLILAGHDVRHTQVGQDDRTDIKDLRDAQETGSVLH